MATAMRSTGRAVGQVQASGTRAVAPMPSTVRPSRASSVACRASGARAEDAAAGFSKRQALLGLAGVAVASAAAPVLPSKAAEGDGKPATRRQGREAAPLSC